MKGDSSGQAACNCPENHPSNTAVWLPSSSWSQQALGPLGNRKLSKGSSHLQQTTPSAQGAWSAWRQRPACSLGFESPGRPGEKDWGGQSHPGKATQVPAGARPWAAAHSTGIFIGGDRSPTARPLSRGRRGTAGQPQKDFDVDSSSPDHERSIPKKGNKEPISA